MLIINAFCHPVNIKFNIGYSMYRTMAKVFDFYVHSKSCIHDVNIALIKKKLKQKQC